jgi:hypothetical protein
MGNLLRRGLGGLALGLLLIAAQAVDPAELAFWQSVSKSNSPAEYRAYLEVYPDGVFAPLARVRAGAADAPAAPAAAPQAATQPAPQPTQQARLRLRSDKVRYVDGITVDVDVSMLRGGSNFVLAVVPADAPDTVKDSQMLALAGIPVRSGRQHLVIPGGPPGQDEVRLYYIPQFASSFAVAARAPVEVGPATAGAVLARDLAREALVSGSIGFESAHRDAPIAVEGEFLDATQDGGIDSQIRLLLGLTQYPMFIAVGTPGVVSDGFGSTGEVVCALGNAGGRALDYVARLRRGDYILIQGVPTTWQSAGPGDPVIIKDCAIIDSPDPGAALVSSR